MNENSDSSSCAQHLVVNLVLPAARPTGLYRPDRTTLPRHSIIVDYDIRPHKFKNRSLKCKK